MCWGKIRFIPTTILSTDRGKSQWVRLLKDSFLLVVSWILASTGQKMQLIIIYKYHKHYIMENSHQHTAGNDPHLWEIAQKRAFFKYHVSSYIVINAFFWIIWAMSGRYAADHTVFPWPIYPMLGWGIGLFFHFLGAYVFPKNNLVEKEYQKLKQQQL